ncbi:MAG: glycosyltransferase family 39 protein [Microthrixaceae bacterium]|nr:glycosyltransferase family 39 protein [Microthrixaceae bacterium]
MSTTNAPGRLAVIAALVVVAMVLLVHVDPWLGAGLGDSHDGYNAAVWSFGARGGADDPIAGRLGGIRADGTPYAHHPPLLVWTLIPVTALAGDSAFALRLVPLVASLVAVAILAALLRDSGLGRRAVVGGVLLAGTSPMLLTYGALVDTPVFGLPFALGAVWAAQRAWQRRPPPAPVAVLVGVGAALAGWQALLAAAIAAAVGAVRVGAGRRGEMLPLASGVVAGVAVDLLWIWWVMGGLADLLEVGGTRTQMNTAHWLEHQAEFAWDLFGPLLLGVWVAVVVGYAVLFRHGSYIHSYWNFYGVALVGIAAAVILHSLDGPLARLRVPYRRVAKAASLAGVFLVAAFGVAYRSTADHEIQTGLEVLPLLDNLPTTVDHDEVLVATIGGDPSKPWLRWATGGTNEQVEVADLDRLDPDRLVLAKQGHVRPPVFWAGTSARTNGHYVLIPAGELAALLR